MIVEAVRDVLMEATRAGRLIGRIDKPYRFYEPVKGADSRRFPQIDLVQTTVQRQNANYFGRYIERLIRGIPAADVELALQENEPVALIIGPKPYLPQIQAHLVNVGLVTPQPPETESAREAGLEILNEDSMSNLGWRIILGCEEASEAATLVRLAHERNARLVEVIPEDRKVAVLREAEMSAAARAAEATEDGVEGVPQNAARPVKLTSYEGAKGLSSQYVVLAGLQDGDMPRNREQVQDLEICRFLVGLTRTRKKCTILITRRFANQRKRPSLFLSWVNQLKFNRVEVNARYWVE